jgi:hypothetical protein
MGQYGDKVRPIHLNVDPALQIQKPHQFGKKRDLSLTECESVIIETAQTCMNDGESDVITVIQRMKCVAGGPGFSSLQRRSRQCIH